MPYTHRLVQLNQLLTKLLALLKTKFIHGAFQSLVEEGVVQLRDLLAGEEVRQDVLEKRDVI